MSRGSFRSVLKTEPPLVNTADSDQAVEASAVYPPHSRFDLIGLGKVFAFTPTNPHPPPLGPPTMSFSSSAPFRHSNGYRTTF
ncbi:hypothetical protein D9619_011768 [Psilocybe cf. subviscida]|uniref:Uncharacterized protein n=1 Tax=Psilocybe cf. subviscida TaxID=2480587 RepID=A0A8H5EW35_9AGAR|nr:hypothetical protein D9619_011768 [Psilocybe cf. subviscida]